MPASYSWPLVVSAAGSSTAATALARRSIFGRGLAYPFRLDGTEARPLIVSEEELVKASIIQILFTEVGERPHLVRQGVPYGTRINKALFSDVDTAADTIKYDVKRALSVWEPRIIVLNVQVTQQVDSSGGATLVTNIVFRYRSTNRSDNFVVPFRMNRSST